MKHQRQFKTTDENDIKEGRYLPIRVHKTFLISRPVNEVYQFWHNFENLPRVMNHLQSVTVKDPVHSHWVVRGPAGSKVEWDAEITSDRENELISWRSMKNAEVPNSGSVEFKPSLAGQTEIIVNLAYKPPAGRLGKQIAKLFGEDASQQIEEDMKQFKETIETKEPMP